MGAVGWVDFGAHGTVVVGLSRDGHHWAWHGLLKSVNEIQRDMGRTAADLSDPFTWTDAAFLNGLLRAYCAEHMV